MRSLHLVVPHTFRFIGLSFLVPGVVAPSLPPAFAAPAAYGDLLAAVLAVAATVALSRRASLATFEPAALPLILAHAYHDWYEQAYHLASSA